MNNGKRKRRIKVLRLFSYLSNTWINSTEKEGKENKTREKHLENSSYGENLRWVH